VLQGGLGRYPTDTGFDAQELQNGGKLLRYLASPLDDELAEKFFNIRGDNMKTDTVGSTTWRFVPPTDPSPITDGPSMRGDDTQPGWSARHLDLLPPRDHVITVKSRGVSHMLMMNVAGTLDEIGQLLGV
jgi:hypothetical protein